MTRPITTAPADTARAMHAAEMRGQDMQDAPERVWVIPDDNEDGCCPLETDLNDVGKFFDARRAIAYTRTDLCLTEAECQRRIDAAVQAEREACEAEVRRQFRIWEDFGASGFDDLCMAIIPESIRARGQK